MKNNHPTSPFVLLAAACLLLLAACSPVSGTPQPVEQTPTVGAVAPAMQGLYGIIDDCRGVSEANGGVTLSIFTANFYSDATQDGFYILDLGTLIQSQIGEDCSFDLQGLPDGQYVLLLGVTAETSQLLVDENGEQVVLNVLSGQSQNAGTLYVRQ